MQTTHVTATMLMAAGLGTRLRPFTQSRTKALIPVLGVPIAQFTLDSLASYLPSQCGLAGGDKNRLSVVANVHHDAERAKAGLLRLQHPGIQIIISDESQLLLGSGGGIRKALPHLGEGPFFLANSDVLCDIDWQALESCHRRMRAQWGVTLTLTLFSKGPEGALYREIFFDPSHRLITGLGKLASGRPYFVGSAILEREAVEHLPYDKPADFVLDILEPAIQRKKAGIFLSTGSWFDIGSPELWLKTQIALIEKLERGEFHTPGSRLWKKRIEERNLRLSHQIWISRTSKRPQSITAWAGPCYWDAEEELEARAPAVLGPHSVLYGSLKAGVKEEDVELRRGIGLGGEWISLR